MSWFSRLLGRIDTRELVDVVVKKLLAEYLDDILSRLDAIEARLRDAADD